MAIFVAWFSYEATDKQYQIAARTLEFACQEAKSSSAETQLALKAAEKAASAAERSAIAAENQNKTSQGSLQIARANQQVNESLLAADLAGEVLIKDATLVNFGSADKPLQVLIKTENVGKTTIVGAFVGANVALLGKGMARNIYKDMRSKERVQTIPLKGEEDQRITWPDYISAPEYADLASGRLRIVAAVTVRWRDPTGRQWHQRSRCWEWYGLPQHFGVLACPGLDEF